MNEHDTKELENIIRLAIQKCFDSRTDEQVFNAVYDYNRFVKQEFADFVTNTPRRFIGNS